MSPANRARLIRGALVAFLALDLLGLTALLYNQLLGVESPILWVVSSVLVLAAFPLLLHVADSVIAMATEEVTIPNSGEKIP